MQVQAVVAEGAVEALDECVLRRLAGLDVLELDSASIGPRIERSARKLRPVVRDDRCRQPLLLAKSFEHLDHPGCRNRMRHVDRQALPIELIQDREASEPSPRTQCVRHEVHAPALIRTRGRDPGSSRYLAPSLPASTPHREPFLSIEPLNPFVVDRPPLALESVPDETVPPAWSLGCQSLDPLSQLLLRRPHAPVSHRRGREAREPNRLSLRHSRRGLHPLDDLAPLPQSSTTLFPGRPSEPGG